MLCACAATQPDRVAANGNPKDPRPREARQRVLESEWDGARQRHSIFAYRRFLDEFPDSPHQTEARKLLEGLRWEQAERDGGETALAGYLADEPRGAHAADAWSRVSALRLTKALSSQSAPLLRAWLAENPSSPGRDQALQAVDDADWRGAGDPAALRTYLAVHL